jgi:hypothetical protein
MNKKSLTLALLLAFPSVALAAAPTDAEHGKSAEARTRMETKKAEVEARRAEIEARLAAHKAEVEARRAEARKIAEEKKAEAEARRAAAGENSQKGEHGKKAEEPVVVALEVEDETDAGGKPDKATKEERQAEKDARKADKATKEERQAEKDARKADKATKADKGGKKA